MQTMLNLETLLCINIDKRLTRFSKIPCGVKGSSFRTRPVIESSGHGRFTTDVHASGSRSNRNSRYLQLAIDGALFLRR